MRGLAAVAVAGVAALMVRRWLSVREAFAAVRPELRSPLLPFMPTVSARALPVNRYIARRRTSAGTGVTVAERHVGQQSVRVLVTEPVEKAPLRPGLLWIHGGGMVVGSPQFELSGIGPTALDRGAVVVAPEYRLAPEHPFPAALDDCMDVLKWMRSHADELGIDRDRIAVTGASAGGGLSATVAQRAYDEGIFLCAQALVYPMLDDRVTLRESPGRGHFLWTRASSHLGWTAYLGRPPSTLAAPDYAAAARRIDLSGLAPAWIGVGELDLLYDESVSYATRLTDCGVPCELVTVPGMYHGAELFGGRTAVMRDFRTSMVEFLRTQLAD